MTHTSRDIENVVGIVARFQANPKESHYTTIKRIFKYLKGTHDFGLWYDRSNDFTLCAYTNVDWVGSIDDRKSTSSGEFFLGGRLVSWLSKKQDYISQSMAKVEYVAAEKNCDKVMWINRCWRIFKLGL